MSIVIDKVRNDSYCHYTMVKDGKTFTGYSLYSKIGDENKKEWLKALDKYQSSNNYTTLISSIKEDISITKFSLDYQEKCFPPKSEEGLPKLSLSFLKETPGRNDLINKLMHAGSGLSVIPTPKNLALNKLLTYWNNLNTDLDREFRSYKSLGITTLANKALSIVEKNLNTFKESNILYNEYTRLYNRAVYFFKQYTSLHNSISKADKKEFETKFKQKMAELNDDDAGILFGILTLDSIKTAVSGMTKLVGTGKEPWDGTISKLKALRDLDLGRKDPQKIREIKRILNEFIPATGAFAAGLLSLKDSESEESEAEKPGLRYSLDTMTRRTPDPVTKTPPATLEDELYERYVTGPQSPASKYREKLKNKAIILDYAQKSLWKYSLKPCTKDRPYGNENPPEYMTYDSSTVIDDKGNICCKISMCDDYEPMDVEDSLNLQPFGNQAVPVKLIVELGQDLHNKRLTVHVGQHVRINDIIGYINDIPIKSKVDCIVTYVSPERTYRYYYYTYGYGYYGYTGYYDYTDIGIQTNYQSYRNYDDIFKYKHKERIYYNDEGDTYVRPYNFTYTTSYPFDYLTSYDMQYYRYAFIHFVNHLYSYPEEYWHEYWERPFATYFRADYYMDQNVLEHKRGEDLERYAINLVNSESTKFSTKDYDEMAENMRHLMYADAYLRDYIEFCRFPDLVTHISHYGYGYGYGYGYSYYGYYGGYGYNSYSYSRYGGYGGYGHYYYTVSGQEMIDIYERQADSILTNYRNSVTRESSKGNVQSYVNAGKTIELKENIDNLKKNAFNNIFNHYNNNPRNMRYSCRGRIRDLLLYSTWYNYIFGDRFDYDDENPYVVKLSDAINSFLGARLRLELNKSSISDLISNFNDECDGILRPYWKFDTWNSYNRYGYYYGNYRYYGYYYRRIDYYSKLCDLFRWSYYKNSSTLDIIPTNSADPEAVGQYKRVYNYLKALTKFTPEAGSKTIHLNENSDINMILYNYEHSSASYDRQKLAFERKLKRIAHKFVSLRKISASIYSGTDYVSDYVVWRYQNLKHYWGYRVDEYAEYTWYSYWDWLWGTDYILRPYLEALKRQAARESQVLRQIKNEAYSWWSAHNDYILEGHIFDKYREIPWPTPSSVYKECDIHDYYLFTDTLRKQEEAGNIFFSEYKRTPYEFSKEDYIRREGDHNTITVDYNGYYPDRWGYYSRYRYRDLGGIPGSSPGGNSIIPPKNIAETKLLSQESIKDIARAKNDRELNFATHPKSDGDPSTLKYWLRYCGIASLVNCMLPIYWSTGFIIAGTPVLMPILYVPLVVVSGRVSMVMGMGICGVCVLPMILFVNPSKVNGSVIIPVNVIVDTVLKMLNKITSFQMPSIEALFAPMIKALESDIMSSKEVYDDIDFQIDEVKKMPIDIPTQYALEQTQNQDSTTKATFESEVVTNIASGDTSGSLNYNSYYTMEEMEEIRKLYTLKDVKAPTIPEQKKSFSNIVVFIDPGHEYNTTHDSNGKITKKASPYAMHKNDSGYADAKLYKYDLEEYEFNRTVSKHLKNMLISSCPGITVRYTIGSGDDAALSSRAGEQYLSVRKYNAAKYMVDNAPNKHAVFVSVHGNAFGNGESWNTAKGWCSFISTNSNLASLSRPLAEHITKAAKDNGLNIRGNGISNYQAAMGKSEGDYGILSTTLSKSATKAHVNKWTTIPALIVENYFYTNKDDVQIMIKQPDLFARVIKEGIINFAESKGWVEGFNSL